MLNQRPSPSQPSLNRRTLLSATAAATAATVLRPEIVRGFAANSAVELGMVGCGGRGNWIAELFKKHGGYRIVAAADYFEDKVNAFAGKHGVEESRRFTGLSACRKLCEGKLDAIAVESPPFFHPEHAAAGVEAGKHVFLAKPIAVDVPGCLSIGESGKKATQKKLVFLVDFQTRASEIYREAIKRVHAGDIGKLISGEAVYYTGGTWGNSTYDNKSPEQRLRHWGQDKVLSGDIITEQNIHALDVASWVIDDNPLTAYGLCGRKGRSGSGDCNDHFAVVYEFPQDVRLSFASKQYGAGIEDIGMWMFGPRGTLDTHYFGSVCIRGQAPYGGGKMGNLFTDGCVANIAEFHKCIQEGRCDNPTAAPSVRSNLTTILGRTAAYRKQVVTWDDMMKAAERAEFDLKALKA